MTLTTYDVMADMTSILLWRCDVIIWSQQWRNQLTLTLSSKLTSYDGGMACHVVVDDAAICSWQRVDGGRYVTELRHYAVAHPGDCALLGSTRC